MKTFINSTAALALMATAALASPAAAFDWCEREITLYQDGQLVDTSALPVYIHGCDRYQYQPLTPQQVINLGEHCSVESYADGGTEEETVEEEVEVTETYEYGVTSETTPWGSQVSGNNLTSNGISETYGDNVLAIRSSVSQTVTVERLGGPTIEVEVGAGYTMVRDEGFAGSATYRATFGTEGGTRVKAAGPQSFTDSFTRVETRTRTVTVEREGNGVEAYMPGPRTDRCGLFGEVIQ